MDAIRIYRGNKISEDLIQELKNIAQKRYSKDIYEEYFWGIKTIKDLCDLHSTKMNEETLVLGTDWFLCYKDSKFEIQFLEWVSLDNDNKIKQTIEMMEFFKHMIINNKDKFFYASMRHNTSYKIYSILKQKGFFKQYKNEVIIDFVAPYQIQNIIQKYKEEYNSLDEFLASNERNMYDEYLKYVLHNVEFSITEKFVDKYDKNKKRLRD